MIMTNKLFIVDTISTLRYRYVIEANTLEDAYDEVCMVDSGHPADEFSEVSYRQLGTAISDGREITELDFNILLKQLSADKSETSSHWLGDKLIRKIDYTR